MQSQRIAAVTICALLVALPMAPCAWIAQGCPFESAGLLAGEQAAKPSCCRNHRPADSSSSNEAPAKPCTRDCCKVRSLPPVAEKVLADQVLVLPLLASIDVSGDCPTLIGIGGGPQTPAVDPPLQILHCQWRL